MEKEMMGPIPEETMTEERSAEESAEEAALPEAVETAEEGTEDVTCRLAEDFLLLAEEFPQFVSPNQLPDVVLDMAVQQRIALLDAYLRYRLQEEKKVAAAAQQQRQAADQSAGSLSRGAVQIPPEQDAFLRAFRSAL